MNNLASIKTVVTTILITLITVVIILSMGNDTTINVILGVGLIIGLAILAGVIMRGLEGKRP
jgi:hypothetical protein